MLPEVKPQNNGQTLPIRYENIDIKEGNNKLSNLIIFYPYNPYKELNQSMSWLKHVLVKAWSSTL